MDEKQIHILLVEDNPADARILYENLVESSSVQFSVTQVGTLADALERLLEGGFEAILLDLSLPDSQSLDTVRRVRGASSQTPIVVLTGQQDEALAVEAVREGAQDYLVKGQVNTELLVRSIRYAMERHRNEEALARYRDHLEELVARRTSALASANVTLQKEVGERTRAEAELRLARAKLVTERERQSRLLAADLHDSVGQELIGLKMALESIAADASSSLAPVQKQALRSATEKCMAIIREMRLISHGLYPPTLESFGLASALKYMAGECKIPVVVHCPEELEEQRFPPGTEICAFRIAQESLQNALRHSQATRIDLHLTYEEGELALAMVDNGVGFDAAQAGGKGLGLLSMHDRTQTCGGKIIITSRPGETRIDVRIPATLPAVEEK